MLLQVKNRTQLRCYVRWKLKNHGLLAAVVGGGDGGGGGCGGAGGCGGDGDGSCGGSGDGGGGGFISVASRCPLFSAI